MTDTYWPISIKNHSRAGDKVSSCYVDDDYVVVVGDDDYDDDTYF